MKTMRGVTGWMMGAALAGAVMVAPMWAQNGAATTSGSAEQQAYQTATDAAPVAGDVSDAQLVTLTVHEAWVASGRNEDKFFDFVKRLATMSAAKRGVALPETEAAGSKTGAWIKKQAKKDPDQLLYAVVDGAVKYTAAHKGS
jgi:hypothetical protein